jgi:hypothetical protein
MVPVDDTGMTVCKDLHESLFPDGCHKNGGVTGKRSAMTKGGTDILRA